jgi:hypothetical protein
MEILVVSGIVAGFIALTEGVKRACRNYLKRISQ